MFVPILYAVFQRMYNVHKPVRTICMIFVDFTRFLSMLPILHGQSVYNMYKPVKTICMLFIDFIRFF
jgi:nucleoside recognition membrane protein YjiH